MKQHKGKIIVVLSIIILIALFLIIVPNFMVSYMNENNPKIAEQLKSNKDSVVTAKKVIDTMSISGSCGDFEVTNFNYFGASRYQVAKSNGRLLFCSEYGIEFNKSKGTLHISTALRYGSRSGSKKNWGWQCRRKKSDYKNETTYPYLECVGNHTDLIKDGNEDVAYIITYQNANQWSQDKQYALWRTDYVESNGRPSKTQFRTATSENIYAQSLKYKDFHEETHKNSNESDLEIVDLTDVDNVKTSVNQSKETYIMGPVTIDYNYGVNNEVTFGGISDMYLIGYNSAGKVIEDRIEINKYYTSDGTGYTLSQDTYFDPNTSDNSYVDYGQQVYPKGVTVGEDEFYFEFSDPNKGVDFSDEANIVSYVKLHIDFKWMECYSCEVCEMEAHTYTVKWTYQSKKHKRKKKRHTDYRSTSYLQENDTQEHFSVLYGNRRLYKSSLEIGNLDFFTLTMQLAGYVWVDGGLDNKENTPYNGVSGDKKDVALPNIKVIIYEQDGTEFEDTVTDSKGCYIFERLNPMEKYYVAFEYNGQLYVPTTYKEGDPKYNSSDWEITSKATEKQSDRTAFNEKFATIKSYPNNYSGGSIYSVQQLVQSGVIDSFFKMENGIIVETDTLQLANKNPTTAQQKFLNDCMILAYTKESDAEGRRSYDLYPYYDKFTINTNEKFTSGSEAREGSFDMEKRVFDGKVYKPIYQGQFFVDLGLVRRKINDLALKKDVLRAVTKINGKTEVYKYTRADDDDDKNWDISVRLSDANYYGGGYNREIFKSDYYYQPNTAHTGAALEVFITYKITLRNQSRGVLNTIDEVADYFDTDYKYRADLSWVTYDDNSFSDDQYFKAMDKEELGQIKNAKDVNSKEENGIVYVHGLEKKKLAAGEKECIYLTFQVNKNNDKLILDMNNDEIKYNVAEINGYTSYYEDNTQLPNGITKNSTDYIGLLDIDSVAGNIDKKDLQNQNKYEDDTDRAKGLRVFYDDSKSRQINGTVWEDLRTEIVGDAIIGNGIKDAKEIGIENVKVELVEKLADGKEYIWKTTTLGEINQEKTNSDGTYVFKDYIPGDYIIRFTYGGEYNAKYNGQDYKSTTYQKGIDQNGRTNLEKASEEIVNYASKLYYGYTDVEKQNTSGSYGYSIIKSNEQPISDAKDIWSDRESVNKYSSNNYNGVTNGLAETLATANVANSNTKMTAETGVISIEVEYNKIFTGDEDNYYHIKDVDLGLTERPKAQLELDKHVEKVKITLANGTILYDANEAVPNLSWLNGKDYNLITNSNYYKSYNSKYNYNANQNDVNGLVGSLYTGGKNGLIQAIIDSELMHGATIKVEYKLTLKNVGETDYTGKAFYYNGIQSGDVVTTSGDIIVDYVSNNLQYREVDNTNWQTVKTDNLPINEAVKSQIKNNTIVQTKKLQKDLKPKEKIEGNIILTQTITTQNTSDDMTYDNIVEIIQYSNSVGRRMAYSVVGNQNPNNAPAEVDSAKAEKIIILPPFGQNYLYIGIAIAVFAILTTGIILIKRKVLKK